ncbi:hypothetical protein WN944_017749 [Citrus x changshan-huyou]|uniref:Uncharacterized protein n=1 Tax=Citrus x changshan-huyou TaxID=2935761 RepID=A0AAP0MBU4_9ROSI
MYALASKSFPSARDLRYTVSYTRPASLKPVKRLGGIATLAILLIPTHDDDVVMAPMAKRMLLSYGAIACHGLQL